MSSKPSQINTKNFLTNPSNMNQAKETPFIERNIEEAENVSVDENGFTRTPNGSFWDNQGEYFNHDGFDKHGGFYDKYMVYIPGPGYNEEKGMYKDDEEFLLIEGGGKTLKSKIEDTITKLKEQEDEDRNVVKIVNNLEENALSQDDDYVEEVNKNDNTYDDEEIKNAINETKTIDEEMRCSGRIEKEENEVGCENKENENLINVNGMNGESSSKFKEKNEKSFFSANNVTDKSKEENEIKSA